jgi:hypothetical protein
MFMKTLAAVSLSTALSGMAHAALTTIGFDSLSGGVAVGATYEEAGFRFTVVSGLYFGGDGPLPSGNPGGAFWVGNFSSPVVGDTVKISRIDGTLFSLDSLDYSGYSDFTPSDVIKFLGLVSGTVIDDSPLLSASSSTYSVFDPGFSAFFDEIQLVVNAPGRTSLLLDNMRFSSAPVSSVPIPSTGLLLLSALGALAWTRRRAV